MARTDRLEQYLTDTLAKLIEMTAAPRYAHTDASVKFTAESIERTAAKLAPEPQDEYHTLVTRYEVLDLDGKQINYGWGDPANAAEQAARNGGGTIVVHHDQREVTASTRVLIDSEIDRAHWPLISADARRMGNMARDAGRPSDAMRSSVAAFKRGDLTEESFAASAPSGHYPDDAR